MTGARDLVGRAGAFPARPWPGGARLAVNVVVNYEEGAESCVLLGDAESESVLTDTYLPVPRAGRDLTVEHAFEYGSRIGFWRLHRILTERSVPVTVYAAGLALELNPAAAEAMATAGWDVAAHGYRWLDHARMPVEVERDHIARTVAAVERLTGRRPVGYYSGRPSASTRELVVEEGGFLYDSDATNDELPYWVRVLDRDHLVVPHSLETTDARCARGQDFARASDLHDELVADFDQLLAEGSHSPRLMTVSVHCRIAGRPARAAAFARFLDHLLAADGVWLTTRREVAAHWRAHHPPRLPGRPRPAGATGR